MAGRLGRACQPDGPPSAGPAAPVVFQERSETHREGWVEGGELGGRGGQSGKSKERRGEERGAFAPCDSGESEQAERGRVLKLSRDFERELRGDGSYAMSQPWLKKETEQLPLGTSKVK